MVSPAIALLSSTMFATLGMAGPVLQARSFAVRTVHQFPNFTWIENMAIRSNGQILGTNLEGGNVFLVDPFQPQNATPPVIACFGNTTALAGITEVEDDVFYAAGIRNSNALAFDFPSNSSTIWKIDMRKYASTGHADVSKVADIPRIGGINGITVLSKSAGTILIADAVAGKIWRFCVRDGSYEIVIDNDVLSPVQGMDPPFGVNGLRVVGSTLYFTNGNKAILGTFKINSRGQALSPPRLISSNVPNADDFAVGPDGSVWLAQNIFNKLVRVFPDGTTVLVAGGSNSTDLLGPVAAKFGRTKKDRNILYISTDGLSFGPQHELLTTNGKIAAIDTMQ